MMQRPGMEARGPEVHERGASAMGDVRLARVESATIQGRH
jgi:hypothetical protein